MTSKKPCYCTACGTEVVGFFTYGVASWGCPSCGSSPRERFVNHCLNSGQLKIPEGAILHIAPSEKSLVSRFSSTGKVEFGDLHPQSYPALNVSRVDLMEMDGNARFDLFYASHVMEHVPDDLKAFRKIYECLKPGGEAWILVPLHNGPTIEADEKLSPKQREAAFGQWDHVRQYGTDIADRLANTGFEVKIYEARSVSKEDFRRFGFSIGDKIFVARRPMRSASDAT